MAREGSRGELAPGVAFGELEFSPWELGVASAVARVGVLFVKASAVREGSPVASPPTARLPVWTLQIPSAGFPVGARRAACLAQAGWRFSLFRALTSSHRVDTSGIRVEMAMLLALSEEMWKDPDRGES